MDDGNNQRRPGGSASLRRRGLLWAAGTVVAAVVVTGIVLDVKGDGGGHADGPRTPRPVTGSASDAGGTAPGSERGLPIVAGFDASGGWRTPVDADTRAIGDPGSPQVAFAPRSQAVVYLDEGGAVRAVRPGDGRELWSWAPELSDYTFSASVAVVDTSVGEYAVVMSRQQSVSVTDGTQKRVDGAITAP